MSAYSYVLLAHLFSIVAFLVVHGSSIVITLQLRREHDPARQRMLLELSRNSVGFVHPATLFVFATGVALGFLGNWWGRLWIWTAIALSIGLWGVMYLLGTRRLDRLRTALGVAAFYAKKDDPEPAQASPDEQALITRSREPWSISTIGATGLAVMFWLMMFKPF